LIYRENNSHEYQDGYKKNFSYNERLIQAFFKNIKEFFEYTFEQNDLNLMFDEIKQISWHYRWAVKTEDKSEQIRNEAGIFLYEILYSLISKYKIENEHIFMIKSYELFNKFIEIQDNNPENNVAYKSFIEKLKEKIIGADWGANYQGYYPAMIKIYFYIFGHGLFSERVGDYEKQNLHLPILLKLAESFPRLYNGFKQEFYDLKKLPIGKKEKLQKEGRKIIDDFLPNNIKYSYEENSLTYYYAGNNYGSKIMLGQIREKGVAFENV
jgi:hypothetical protein